jgi:hypothetical protein
MNVYREVGSASHRRRPGARARGPHGEKPVLHPAHVHCATPPKNAPAAPHPGCVSRTVPFSIALQVHVTRAGAHAHTSTYPPWVAGRRRTPPPPRPTLPAVDTRAGSSLAPVGCRPDRGWAGCACRPCPAECAPRPRRPWTHSSPWQAGVGLGRGLDWMRWLPTTKRQNACSCEPAAAGCRQHGSFPPLKTELCSAAHAIVVGSAPSYVLFYYMK